jgi:hypothetical protein
MAYTCQNCGTDADDSSNLCKPISKELESKSCGVSASAVCNDKLAAMKYSCDGCGSVSADAAHLCKPTELR